MISQRCTQLVCLLASLLLFASTAFSPSLSSQRSSTSTLVLYGEGTGGWGLGNSRDMVPEEFAKGSERRAFEGYELSDRGAFMRKVRQDAVDMKSNDLNELLGVAKIAGINVKNPSERLNKFDSDLLEDDEDLDLSV